MLLQQSREFVHVPITGPDAAKLTAEQVEFMFGAAGAWFPASTWDGKLAGVEVGPGTAVGVLPVGEVPVTVRLGGAELVSAGMLQVGGPAWRPTVDQVHALIASRPAFTATSRPSAADVDGLVDLALDSLDAELPAVTPAQFIGKARYVVALHAAALVESTFYPEQQFGGDTSATERLFSRYTAELLGLRSLLGVTVTDGTGASGSDSRTFNARSMPLGMAAYAVTPATWPPAPIPAT